MWDTNDWEFGVNLTASVDIVDGLIVDGLAATDINHDGDLDLLVQVSKKNPKLTLF